MSRLRGDTGQTASIVGALAAPHVPSAWPRANGDDTAGARLSFGAVVLAAALPLIFLHSRYQPDLGFGAGGTHVSVTLSDLAVLAVSGLGLAAVMRLSGWSWNLFNLMALPLILGSLMVTAGAVLIAVPIGIASAVYLAEIAPFDAKITHIEKEGGEVKIGLEALGRQVREYYT